MRNSYRGPFVSCLLVVLSFVLPSHRAGAQSLGEALDATQYVWTVGGAGIWSNQTSVTHDGVDAAQSGFVTDIESSWFQTSVTGPVTVTFWWKADSEFGADTLQFYVDNVRRDEISGTQDWVQVSYNIVAGTHTIRWIYQKDDSLSVGADAGWVDQIVIEPPQSLPFGDVLDATQLVWTTGGSTNWKGQTIISHDGVDAAQSGTITHNQETWLQTSVTGPVVITFWCRVDSEENFDFLTFSVDGFDQNALSGFVDWQYQSFALGGGIHTARWTYAKDVTGSAGADGSWVDEIQLFPQSPPATRFVATNSPIPRSPFTNWQTAARSIQQAVDVAQPGDIVLVSNGVYAAGVRALPLTVQRNRLVIDKPVTVRSVNGPQFTYISGSPDVLLSNGVRSVRCVYVTNGASLSGFTLTNGYSSSHGGGVLCEPGGIVSNCLVLRNNAIGSSGGGASGGTYFNCVFYGNRAVVGGGVSSGRLYNCSIASNRAATGGGTYACAATNCIVFHNSAEVSPQYESVSFTHSCTEPQAPGDHNITNDPQFVDLAAGDLRLTATSRCLGGGTNAYWMASSLDLDGNPRIAGLSVDMGAYERLLTGYEAWAFAITNGLTNYNDCATGDGYYNILKYATGSSPTNSDALARLTAVRSNAQLQLLFYRNTSATDVTITVEAGHSVTNGAPWLGLATNTAGSWGNASNVSESGVGSPVSVNVADTAPTATNRFLRLRVSRP